VGAPAEGMRSSCTGATEGGDAEAQACAKNLVPLARQSILSALPVGYRLRDVVLSDICVPRSLGRVRARAVLPESVHGGRNDGAIYFGAPNKPQMVGRVFFDLEPTMAARATSIIARGAEVKIIVHSPNVTVQASAVAQEAAGLGESIQVLPSGGTRVIRGRVIDARTVEVSL
jgi:hypothetical protein